MTSSPEIDPPAASSPDGALTVSEEQLRVVREWVVAGRVGVSRRIVTERRSIEIEVRREIVEIHGDTVDFHDGHLIGTDLRGPAVEPPPATALPLVVTLHEEVPVVTFGVRPYEQLTLTTTRTTETRSVADTVRREHTEISMHPPDHHEEN